MLENLQACYFILGLFHITFILSEFSSFTFFFRIFRLPVRKGHEMLFFKLICSFHLILDMQFWTYNTQNAIPFQIMGSCVIYFEIEPVRHFILFVFEFIFICFDSRGISLVFHLLDIEK